MALQFMRTAKQVARGSGNNPPRRATFDVEKGAGRQEAWFSRVYSEPVVGISALRETPVTLDTKEGSSESPQRYVPSLMHQSTKEIGNPSTGNGTRKKRRWYMGKNLDHAPFTVRNQLQRTIFDSWVNILLLAAPVGIAINFAGINGKAVFVVNFIAIIPLARMLSFATEEISLRVGESFGGLLNASFG